MPTRMDEPRLDCLPPAQRLLWDRLDEVPAGFVLYGGTALALWLGHRESEDFDFFSGQPFDPGQLLKEMAFLQGGEDDSKDDNTLFVALPDGGGKVSFFGGLSSHMRSVHEPAMTADGVAVASIADIFGCKCAAVQKRATYKDYFDIWAILEQTDYTLADGLSFASAIYENAFAPHLTLQALSYFKDLDKPLPEDKQERLLKAVQGVELGRLPVVRGRPMAGHGREGQGR